MLLVRPHIVRAALVALLSQTAAILLPPVAMCCTELASAMTSDAIVCDCEHGPNAMCPMHKGAKKPAPPERRDDGTAQWCTGHHGSDHSGVPSARVEPGLTETATELQRPESRLATPRFALAGLEDLSRPPTTPPPRA
jgi:hypothetical protein